MDRCILFGAGYTGNLMIEFLKSENYGDYVCCFCDTDINKIGKELHHKPIVSYDEAKLMRFPIVLSVTSEAKNEIIELLDSDGIRYYEDVFQWFHNNEQVDSTVLSRKFCGFYHIKDMDAYFRDAERDAALDKFWGARLHFTECSNV